MPNYQFIREEDFDKAEPSFINFPETIFSYIQENIHQDGFVKMQQKLKTKIFDKTAVLYKINHNIFIQDPRESRRMYWLYTDGKTFYLVDFLTNDSTVEDSVYVKGTDDDIIYYLIIVGVIKTTMPSDYLDDYHRWKRNLTAINREKKINQILDEF